MHEHLILRARVVLPARDGLQIHRGELPLAQRVGLAGLEAADLLFIGHGEPVLAQDDAVLNQQALEDRSLVQEAAVFLGGAEAHHALHAGAVVPRAVEDDDLSGGGKLLDVALEVPLALLARVGGWQSLNAADARAEVLGDALNRGPLARRIAPLHHDDDAGSGFHHPLLHFDEFSLEPFELLFVGLFVQLGKSIAHCSKLSSSRSEHLIFS